MHYSTLNLNSLYYLKYIITIIEGIPGLKTFIRLPFLYQFVLFKLP